MIAVLESGPDRDSSAVKEQVIQISSRANVISSQTAFIAINKDLNQPLQGPMVRRNVPLPRAFGCAPMVMLQSCTAVYQGPMMGNVCCQFFMCVCVCLCAYVCVCLSVCLRI
ncbi:von Willebrand factor A domain-containing protein 5A-like [Chiloscyllium plagiosum]|uniref:von Willebrand factor A domain-containing protein 5A-like n=1 Tax=Chiloscyllium plagiosum TaxID=36176 RepID=UPI001CB7B5FF|nr:von Willebrand factor A domain-containing protein 5A-like [Chiloscyllium plagiosum]